MKILTFIVVFIKITSVIVNGQDMFSVRQLTSETAHEGFPCWSPDGKYIAYQYTDIKDTLGLNGLWVMSADGTDRKQIFKGVAEHPKWSPDNKYIIFDADTGKNVKMIPVTGGNPIKILPDTIVIFRGGMPSWSPNGKNFVFLEGKYLNLCIMNIETRKVTSIYRENGIVPLPGCWSPDGKSIYFARMERSTRKSTIWKISADGKEKKQIPGHLEDFYRYLALSPDGSLLAYAVMVDKMLRFYVMPAEGGKSIPFIGTQQGHNESASWSPDGKQVVFASSRSSNGSIWIMDVGNEIIKKKLQEN